MTDISGKPVIGSKAVNKCGYSEGMIKLVVIAAGRVHEIIIRS